MGWTLVCDFLVRTDYSPLSSTLQLDKEEEDQEDMEEEDEPDFYQMSHMPF